MKIPFMLRFPWGEQTLFIEKLWAMAIKTGLHNFSEYDKYLDKAAKFGIYVIPFKVVPKLHTIRDCSDRFKIGAKVQPFVWTFKPYKNNPNIDIPAQFDFMPPLEIVSKQRFDLDFVSEGQSNNFRVRIRVDGRELSLEEMKTLAINDGFDNLSHYLKYFNYPVINKEIRHFTDLRY